ncbi:MAG: NB-ARC domain-containing protein [Campylobacterales bacterium]|nr:NB-ARC domain-containing protein [Campylobacterales bacterium]
MKVFIASSGDLEQERKDLKLLLYDEGFTPIVWETIDQSITENKFQDRINEEYLKTSDVIILIVKSRLGKYTIEEFEIAYKNLGTKIKRMYVYFLSVDMHEVDRKEQNKINALKDFLEAEGKLYKVMENLDKLKLHFLEQKKYFENSQIKGKSYQTTATLFGIPKYRDENIFGRDEDLKDLEKLLQKNNHLALINGFGGIGKTTLASKYYLNSQNIYDNMYWMEFSNSLKETFVNFHLTLFEETSNLSEDEIVSKVLHKINNTHGHNLLVIDNVHDNKNTELIESINNNCKVLITSRKSFESIETLELKILSLESSKKIFKKYYTKECNENTLDEIIKKTAGHALTVELLAKASNKNKRKSLEDILAHMLEVGFDLSKVLNENFDESLVVEQLVKRFEDDLKDLNDTQKLILQNLSILTAQEFNEKKFLTWMGVDEDDYDNYEASVESLVEIGLIKRVGDSKISMHQVISEVVKKVLSLEYKNCEKLIRAISDEIALDSSRSFTRIHGV